MLYRHRHYCQGLVLLFVSLTTSVFAFGAEEDFEKFARQALAETHARYFLKGNIEGCVSLYAVDAKFFVDNKLVASGAKDLLELYRGLRDVDKIRSISIAEFLDAKSDGSLGWVIFTYKKDYDLRTRDLNFKKSNKLEGSSSVILTQYGTALFAKVQGQWKVQTMSVFDPEIWERKK